jgi:hypothetical protein
VGQKEERSFDKLRTNGIGGCQLYE